MLSPEALEKIKGLRVSRRWTGLRGPKGLANCLFASCLVCPLTLFGAVRAALAAGAAMVRVQEEGMALLESMQLGSHDYPSPLALSNMAPLYRSETQAGSTVLIDFR